MGTQDDFAFAQEFISTGELEDSGVTFLWEPNFGTWQAFDVRRNSDMILVAPDLSAATDTFFGFGEDRQQQVLDALSQFEPAT